MVNEPDSGPTANALPRRRSFVAGAIRPPMPNPGEILPELPVLTEIVDPDAGLPAVESMPPPTQALDTQAVQEMAQEMAQGLARDMAQDMAQALARDMAQDMAQGLARDMAQEMAQGLARDMAQEMAQGLAQEMARDQARDMASDMARQMAPELARELAPDLARELAPDLARARLAEILPVRRRQAAQALSDWLDAELPGIVTRVLDGLADHIVAQVTLDVRNNLQPRLDAALEHADDTDSASDTGVGSTSPWPVPVGPS